MTTISLSTSPTASSSVNVPNTTTNIPHATRTLNTENSVQGNSTTMNRTIPNTHTERGNTPFDTDAYATDIREPVTSVSQSTYGLSRSFRNRKQKRKFLLILFLFVLGSLMTLFGAIYDSYAALGIGIIALLATSYPTYVYYQKSRGNPRFQLDDENDDDDDTSTSIRW